MNTRIDYAWSTPGGLLEKPGAVPGATELWGYNDRFAYHSGDQVDLRVHTTAASYDVEIIRDGARPETVFTATGLPGTRQDTPDDAYATGCDWATSLTVDLTEEFAPGYYLVIFRTVDDHGREIEQESFFIVRPHSAEAVDLLLVHATSTMLAYNDWGGGNHYRGLPDGDRNDIPSPYSSMRQPVARGMLRKPIGAPRNAHTDVSVPIGWEPRHPSYEWAWQRGYSRHHNDAGWANYERPFTVWAEEQGYRVGHITQAELHAEPEVLDGYPCVVIVGHDEYWSWEMRDTLDSYVDGGGHVARFGGNYVWQVRLDLETGVQTCFKDPTADPIRETDPSRLTTAWDAPEIGRPGAETMGLTGLGGAYIRYGSAVPRGSGGFTVYRESHWSLADTDLYYGDVFGQAPLCIAAFEVDGCDYTFRFGLPYATGADGAPEDLEIIAMAPAVSGGVDRWGGRVPIGAPAVEAEHLFAGIYPDGIPPHHQGNGYGAAMIATFTRGQGEVYCAGTTDWPYGLAANDPFVVTITRNVLDRYLALGRCGATDDAKAGTASAKDDNTTEETR